MDYTEDKLNYYVLIRYSNKENTFAASIYYAGPKNGDFSTASIISGGTMNIYVIDLKLEEKNWIFFLNRNNSALDEIYST